MGEETTSAIQSAMTNLATTIADDGVDMLAAIVPAAAPIIAAVVVAGLGYKFVKRFTGGSAR